jgi:plasmid stability protein
MLMHRTELGLTPDQIQRLEVLAATHKRTTEELVPQVLRGVADLMAAASGEVDLDAARAAYDRLSRTGSEMLMTDLRIIKDARQTLTPEQRTRWDAMRDEMSVMMRMMGSMSMGRMGPMGPMSRPGGPMMPHRHHGAHHEGHAEHCR